MMTSSGMATLCLPDRFATPDEPAVSCLCVELQRSRPTGRCPCPRGLQSEWKRSFLQLGSLSRYREPNTFVSSTSSAPDLSVTCPWLLSRRWRWATSPLRWPVSCGSPGQLQQDGWIWLAARSQSKRPTAPFCLRASAPESAAQVFQIRRCPCDCWLLIG